MESSVKYFRERDLPALTGETKDVCRRLIRQGKIPHRLLHGRRIYPRAQTLTAIEKLTAAGEIAGGTTVRASTATKDPEEVARDRGRTHARAIGLLREGKGTDEIIEELELSLEEVEKLRKTIAGDERSAGPSVARTRLEQKRAALSARVDKYRRRTA